MIGGSVSVKKELRVKLRSVLAGLSPAEVKERSVAAGNRLFAEPEYRKAEIVMAFLSIPTAEIDTSPIILRAWQDRKRVLVPKVSWEQRRLLPIQLSSMSDGLAETPLGIREPINGVPIPVRDIDLVIVPGLGFDAFGNRLGRGRGFYDRFLAHKDWRGVACALAFEEQFVSNVPTGPRDVPMDMLVTDQKVRRFAPQER
jgi:5-formyltetrahydrofolate cyclo-ligase